MKMGAGIGLNQTLGNSTAIQLAEAIRACDGNAEMKAAAQRISSQLKAEPNGAKVGASVLGALADDTAVGSEAPLRVPKPPTLSARSSSMLLEVASAMVPAVQISHSQEHAEPRSHWEAARGKLVSQWPAVIAAARAAAKEGGPVAL